MQSGGLGGLNPNTILISWPDYWQSNEAEGEKFVKLLYLLQEMKKAIVICKNIKEIPLPDTEREGEYIDIWWIIYDGSILLLISHLIQNHKKWRDCKLRVFLVIEHDNE